MAISDREAQRLNYSMPVANDLKLGDIIKELLESGGGGDVTWDTLPGKPSSFPPESHTHTADSVTVTSIPNATGSNVQEVLEDLAARIAALENGGGE